jgi:opacity protein-like surface antigen
MTRKIILGAAALGVLSFALPACAQQYAAPIPFRPLSDPAYLPVQGQWYGTTAFDMSESSGDLYDSTGARTATRKGWEDVTDQELGYGITDDLDVRIGDSYVPYEKAKDEFTGGGSAEHDKSGFRDPHIGLTWRALDQAHYPVNVDLIGDYRMNLLSARTTNVAEGGQSGAFGLAVSKVMPVFTIYGQALAQWYGAQSEFNPASTNFAREASYWDYLLNLQTQTRFSSRFSFNVGAGYVFANSATVQNFGTGVTHIADPGNGWKLNAALNYAVTPNVVASLTYDYGHDNTNKQIFATPALDTFLRNHTDNQVGVKFAYDSP